MDQNLVKKVEQIRGYQPWGETEVSPQQVDFPESSIIRRGESLIWLGSLAIRGIYFLPHLVLGTTRVFREAILNADNPEDYREL